MDHVSTFNHFQEGDPGLEKHSGTGKTGGGCESLESMIRMREKMLKRNHGKGRLKTTVEEWS